MGSIFEWHDAHAGLARCASNCCRIDAVLPSPDSFSGGTSGGGGGGGAASKFSRTHLPRITGDVRVGYDVTASTAPIVITPPRWLSVSSTRRKRLPSTYGMP